MDLIVGDDDCETIQVCNLLEKLETYELIIAKLNDIALKLGVPADKRHNIKTGLKLNTTSYEALNEILTSWRAKYSDEARLSVFLEVLDLCELSHAAEKLREAFSIERGPVLRQYECPPTGMAEFLSSHHKLLVISTLDKHVTASKLKDNTSCMHTNDRFEFVKKLELVTSIDKKLYSFECNDNFNIADVLEFILSAVKYKAVIITEEKLKSFGEMHTKTEGVMFIEDTFEWTHLTPSYQLVVAEKFIKISGKRMTLREFRKKIRHLTDEMPSGQHLLHIINDKEPNLDKNTIPPCVSYYVPRRISPRSLLNPGSIFNMEKGQDKFMISGIDQFELSKYAKPETTDTSTNQRQMLEPKAARYIILDMEQDFDELSKKITSPSHWIRHDKGQFSWVRSSGQINTIQKALESKNDQAEYSEQNFLDFLKFEKKSKTHVVISDTPGMGKSQLLSSLAGPLRSQGEIVLFGAIPGILKALKLRLEQGKEIEPVLLDILSNLGDQSRSVSKYLRQALNTGSDHINVMLDGLDEIESDDITLAESVLKTISTFQSVRMWITTRPHYLETSEKWLQVLGNNIQPFNPEDQLNCLTRYWQQIGVITLDGKRLLEHRLNGLAKTCLDTLQLCIRSKDWDIAGIPLQCMLLGEVFEREARNYANPDIPDSDAVPPPINIRSITDLYSRLVEKKLDTYFERFPSSNYSKEQIKHAHMFLAVKILFPKWADEARNLMGPNFELVKSEDMLNVGLMEKYDCENESNFIHRTIAEYFASDFVLKVINEGSKNESACKIMETVLESTDHDASVNFKLESHKTQMAIYSQKFIHEVVVYFIDNLIQPKMLLWHINASVGMVNSCVTGNFVNIFSHLSKSNKFQDFLQKSISPELVVSCVMYSDLSIVRRICGMYTNCSLIIIPGTSLQDVTLLHLAVRFREYEVVEYLVHSQGFLKLLTKDRLKGLIYYCLHDSSKHNDSVIREKVLTLKFLHRHFPSLIHSASYHFPMEPLLIDKAHVVLLCELITLGADVFVTDENGSNILEHTAKYLNSKDYYKLLSHIPIGSMSILVPTSRGNCYSRLNWILANSPFDLKPESYMIFKNAGTNFTGEFGTSLLESAIEGGKGIITFEQLVIHGAKWQATNQKVWTMLHMAMAYCKFPSFQYFATKFTDDVCLRQQILEAQRWSDLHHVDFGLLRIYINAQDFRGWTIMHHLSGFRHDEEVRYDEEVDIEVMKLLLQMGADIHIRNAKGLTVIENSVFWGRDVIQLELLETHGAIQSREMAIRVVKLLEKKMSDYPLSYGAYWVFIGKIITKWDLDSWDLSVFGGHKCVVQ